MNDEFRRLDAEQQAAVREAIRQARLESGVHRVNTSSGEAYAYPIARADGERIHWGFDDAKRGNVARGVIEAAGRLR